MYRVEAEHESMRYCGGMVLRMRTPITQHATASLMQIKCQTTTRASPAGTGRRNFNHSSPTSDCQNYI